MHFVCVNICDTIKSVFVNSSFANINLKAKLMLLPPQSRLRLVVAMGADRAEITFK